MNENVNPLVVVWCLTYNQEDYIRDALDGFVMQQTSFPFEVIVHDDASTDGTTEIINDYAKKYPNIVKPMIETDNQWKKGGLKHIINILNEHHRRGKYIAFCEGDDFWTDKRKLQKQVDFLESHPDYSLCFHSAKIKYETDTIAWINCEDIEDRDYEPTDIFINWTIPTASAICRKEAMDFYSNLKGAERIQNYDIFIFLSCAMVGKLRGMHEQMSVYRIQGEGLTYNQQAMVKTRMNNPNHFRCLKENFPVVDSRPIDETISKTYFERAEIQCALLLKLRDFWMSFKYCPVCFIRMYSKMAGRLLLRKGNGNEK